MVAISLYRGELHRVPSVPRLWPIPPHAITLRQFKLLRDKRSEVLARLFPGPVPFRPSATAGDPAVTSGSQLSCGNGHVATPNDGKGKSPGLIGDVGMGSPSCVTTPNDWKGKTPGFIGDEGMGSPNSTVLPDSQRVGLGDRGLTSTGGMIHVKEERSHVDKGQTGLVFLSSEERPATPHVSQLLVLEKVNGTDSEDHNLDEDGGKKELQKKLEILSGKKHLLVQMLKQILKAEEEMKKKVNTQPSAARAALSLSTVDTTSLAKHSTTKLSVDVNCGDLGGETDSIDPNAIVHQVSPSLRVAYTASGNAQAISSVSGNTTTISPRFVPGQLGCTSGLPSPSLSGTHFLASTPSPAASRAFSSVFKDPNVASP